MQSTASRCHWLAWFQHDCCVLTPPPKQKHSGFADLGFRNWRTVKNRTQSFDSKLPAH
jgi:hypothetical protein